MPMMPGCQARPCHALPAVSCAREAGAATLQQWRLHDYNQRIPERALVSIAQNYSLNTFNDKTNGGGYTMNLSRRAHTG